MMSDNGPSITEIIGRYLDLKRAGKEWCGLCPFHNEKTPSFYVNEEKGVFNCFGCGEGGDVITFIQKIEQVDFKTALNHLGIADGTRSRTKRQESKDGKSLNAVHRTSSRPIAPAIEMPIPLMPHSRPTSPIRSVPCRAMRPRWGTSGYIERALELLTLFTQT